MRPISNIGCWVFHLKIRNTNSSANASSFILYWRCWELEKYICSTHTVQFIIIFYKNLFYFIIPGMFFAARPCQASHTIFCMNLKYYPKPFNSFQNCYRLFSWEMVHFWHKKAILSFTTNQMLTTWINFALFYFNLRPIR